MESGLEACLEAMEIAMDAIESETDTWLWSLPWMRWKVEQNRHLAMDIAMDAMESGAKQTLG